MFADRKTPYNLLHWKFAPKESAPLLQEDTVVNSWTRKNPCNVVISASALATMFNLWGFPNVTHGWTVPCLVRKASCGAKTLYVNKPFVEGRVTTREKSAYAFKKFFELSGTSGPRGSETARAEIKMCGSSLDRGLQVGNLSCCSGSAMALLYDLWDLDGVSV